MVADGGDYIGRAEAFRLKGLRVEIDLNLSLFASVKVRNRSAWNGDQLRTNEIRTEIVELLLADAAARDGKLQYRHRRGVIGDD